MISIITNCCDLLTRYLNNIKNCRMIQTFAKSVFFTRKQLKKGKIYVSIIHGRIRRRNITLLPGKHLYPTAFGNKE